MQDRWMYDLHIWHGNDFLEWDFFTVFLQTVQVLLYWELQVMKLKYSFSFLSSLCNFINSDWGSSSKGIQEQFLQYQFSVWQWWIFWPKLLIYAPAPILERSYFCPIFLGVSRCFRGRKICSCTQMWSKRQKLSETLANGVQVR